MRAGSSGGNPGCAQAACPASISALPHTCVAGHDPPPRRPADQQARAAGQRPFRPAGTHGGNRQNKGGRGRVLRCRVESQVDGCWQAGGRHALCVRVPEAHACQPMHHQTLAAGHVAQPVACPQVVLVTDKTSTPPMFKSLSQRFAGTHKASLPRHMHPCITAAACRGLCVRLPVCPCSTLPAAPFIHASRLHPRLSPRPPFCR